ncbi:hypothetical protein LWI28_027263 [Acer negundo]|uniref:Uncharacterized protein n=1 Tax=Acer negundo TaxID=4023 RepID=A0AAD5IAV3_ACENE|nr:hypothetical protein LWI28_027263 [Acer negundo]
MTRARTIGPPRRIRNSRVVVPLDIKVRHQAINEPYVEIEHREARIRFSTHRTDQVEQVREEFTKTTSEAVLIADSRVEKDYPPLAAYGSLSVPINETPIAIL